MAVTLGRGLWSETETLTLPVEAADRVAAHLSPWGRRAFKRWMSARVLLPGPWLWG